MTGRTHYLITEERLTAIREVLRQALRLVQVIEETDDVLLSDEVREQTAMVRATFEEHSGISL